MYPCKHLPLVYPAVFFIAGQGKGAGKAILVKKWPLVQ
ncbi:hypothetical protein FOB24_13080 [Citrobacter werkmanii]|nr:hypothetical protein FOB24_13080 [Citrobacter werkmanii]